MPQRYIVQKLDGRYLSSWGVMTDNLELAVVYEDRVHAQHAADYIGQAIVKTWEEAKHESAHSV